MSNQEYNAEHPEIQAIHWFKCPLCKLEAHYSTSLLRNISETAHYVECFAEEDPQISSADERALVRW